MLKVSKSAFFAALPLLSSFFVPLSALAQSTERVDVTSNETQVFRGGAAPDISADGDLIVFESAGKLSRDNNNVEDVFRRNLRTGTTKRVSISSSEQGGPFESRHPSISGSGRFVAFHSHSRLVPEDTGAQRDIFVRDVLNGITERVSVSSTGIEGNGDSNTPDISRDGRFVAFQSGATNLVAGDEIGGVLVHDRQTGITERVSVSSTGNQGRGSVPAISEDGRYVAFQSGDDDLVPGDTNGTDDVFVHDRVTGVTEGVSVDSSGNQGNDVSFKPSLNADGRYVVFSSAATNLVSGDTNDGHDIFVHDRVTGVTERVSVSSTGTQANGSTGFGSFLSADGRYVAFSSSASNLVSGDTNECEDVFRHDRSTGVTERVSVSSSGAQANECSFNSAINSDGNHVAFESFASNLVIGDTNRRKDVFVRHLAP